MCTVCVGELSGTSNARCACDGSGGFCEAAHRKRRQHAPVSDNQSAGGALQHGTAHSESLHHRDELFKVIFIAIAFLSLSFFGCRSSPATAPRSFILSEMSNRYLD